MLRVEDLRVFIGQNEVLRGVSIEVDQGQSVAVLGANGAGKSTLIRAVLGLIRPSRGRILFEGREIQGLPAHQIARLGLACVPEGRRVFGDMSLLDNLRLGAYLPGPRQALDQTLEEVLALFPALAGRLRQRAATLSGGEQQMLSIGRALMGRPSLLLVDELSLGLAPVLVQGIYRVLREVGRRISLLLVEQNVEQALGNSQRAYILETGRIVRQGRSEDLLRDQAVKEAYLGL